MRCKTVLFLRLRLQVLLAAVVMAHSFPVTREHLKASRPAFVKNAVDSAQIDREESAKTYVIARGDGSSGGGGVPMKKTPIQRQQGKQQKAEEVDVEGLVRPKVGAPMPNGRPSWFRVPSPSADKQSRYAAVKESLADLSLNTVCEGM